MKHRFVGSKKIADDSLPTISYHSWSCFFCYNQTDSCVGKLIFTKQTDQVFTKNLSAFFPTYLKFYCFSNSVLRSQSHGPHKFTHFLGTLTVKRALPFRRLLLNTFRPEVVAIRDLNPCFLFLLTLLG